MMGLEGLLTGHLLCDRYRVERVIGRGGMGAVYCATDVRLERAVAVKVITAVSADVAARMRLRARFHREARAAARLQHPNVVTVFDFGTDPRLDLDFLVMELLRGEDAAVRLARAGPLRVAVACEILEQAARGVAAGHQLGLIHRDIKPGNLFLVEEGGAGLRVCVLDFGIVQLCAEDDEGPTMTHLTVAGRAPHSPAYAAPEQLLGETRLTPACDVWGLAATGFHLLTGERPFSDTEQRRMTDGMPVPAPSARQRNPAVPPHLDDLLRIALSHRAADRFGHAAEFAEALAGARRGAAPQRSERHADATRDLDSIREVRPPPAEDDHTLLDPAARPAANQAKAARRWGFAPRLPTAPALAEHTLLDPALAAAGAAARPAPAASAAPAEATMAVSPPDADPAAEFLAPPRRSWVRRALSAAWQLGITAMSLALAGAFGVGMFRAFTENLVEPFYASVAGLTLALPWAVHRLFGRRGSYLLAVLGCIGVAVAAFRFLAPVAGPHVAIIALPAGQFIAAAWIARLTRRRERRLEAGAMSPSVSL